MGALLAVSAGGGLVITPAPVAPGLMCVLTLDDGPTAMRGCRGYLVTGCRRDPDGEFLVDGEFVCPLSDGELTILAGEA
jgi:hypothetical protein